MNRSPTHATHDLAQNPRPWLPDLLADLLAEGWSVEMEVTGGSMAPCLLDGDVVTVAPIRGAPELGDIVVWVDRRRLLVHRVVARHPVVDGPPLWVTRGDAVPFADPAADLSEFLGTVVAARRRGRPLRWGLGRGRRTIARLSRWGWWAFVAGPWRWWVRRQ